jgi:hypothetical protein
LEEAEKFRYSVIAWQKMKEWLPSKNSKYPCLTSALRFTKEIYHTMKGKGNIA